VKRNKDDIILLAGILFFLLGLLSLIFIDKESQNKYQNIVQKNVDKVLGIAQSEQEKVISTLADNKRGKFDQYAIPTLYPYYIFKNDSLVYWSNYQYVPEHEIIKSKRSVFFQEYNRNFGLFVKSSKLYKQDKYEIVSIINLYKYVSDEEGYLKSGFDYSIFYTIPSTISQNRFEDAFSVKDSKDGRELFYIKAGDTPETLNLMASKLTLVLFVIGILLITVFCYRYAKTLLRNQKYFLAGLNFLLLVVFIRLWMRVLGLPWRLFPDGVIPEYLVDSSNFGNQIITAFALLLVFSYISLWQYKALSSTDFSRLKIYTKSFVSVLLVLAVVALAVGCYSLILYIYKNNFVGLHYSMRFYLTNFRGATYIFLFILFGVYFLGIHLSVNLYSKLQNRLKFGFLHWLYGTLLGLIVCFYYNLSLWVPFSTSMYFFASYLLRLPRYFYILRFRTFVYFLSGALGFTLVLFYVVIHQEKEQSLVDKEAFAGKVLLQKDLKAEILLNQFSESVRTTSAVADAFERPVLAYEAVSHLVKDSLLDPYFDVFDVNVYAFDFAEKPLKTSSVIVLNQMYARYAKKDNRTDYPDLYFERSDAAENHYILFSEIKKDHKVIGMLALKIGYDSQNVRDVFSLKGLGKEPDLNNYSYAVYDKNERLISTHGSFKYRKSFRKSLLIQEEIYHQEIWEGGSLHFAKKDKNGNVVVVSNTAEFYKDSLSNFSYLYLVSLLGIVFLLVVLGVLSGFRTYRINFSSKIQFYLNLAFLLPLTIIILLTLGVVITSFVSIQNRALLENSTSIANAVNLHFQNFESGKSSRAFLYEQLDNLASSSNFELGIFDTKGKLTYTSSPGYYEHGQLSQYINPEAYSKILSQGNSEILLEERIGILDFKTAYLAGTGLGGQKYGIIGVAYTDADIALEQQIKEVVAAILIIFIIMFIVLLGLSYTASTNLTEPLRLVAQKLKKTNFHGGNEEIVWRSNDEIGLLTSEYNRMIHKLEESKEALSASEKQTAWREMAKQVAHEIKNPLTPMKLSIQQLQRTLPIDNPENSRKIERALTSINEQIDNISDIANSFSEFAKMPVPRNELFDLVSAVQKIIDLYIQNNNIKIDFVTDSSEIMVSADRMILSRAVTNLILNGIQSVPANRTPVIKVVVSGKRDTGLVEVRDNGSGIAEEVRNKVFIPNFSTKVGGSGLGLSMAKRGIEHSGGNLWFESVIGEGTTFYLELLKPKYQK
jgi:two-component system nitrogen regulation sensor histidine kinase NtrY